MRFGQQVLSKIRGIPQNKIMSNLARKIEFAPRSDLRRTLKYQPHLKWFYKSILAIDGFLWFAVLATITPDMLKASPLTALMTIGLVSIFPAVIFLLVWFQIRPLALTTIEVFRDSLEIDIGGKKSKVSYQDIKQLEFFHIPSLGGWFRISTPNGKYQFTVVLERSEYILESIMSFDRDLVPAERLESYRKTALQSDHSWAFFYSLLRSMRKEILSQYLVVPAIAALVFMTAHFLKYHTINLTNIFLLMMVSETIRFSLGAIALLVISTFHLKKTRAALDINPNHLLRDLEYERRLVQTSEKYQKILFPSFAVIYCAYIMFG